MKNLILLLSISFSFTTLADETFLCTSNKSELTLKVSERKMIKLVHWSLKFSEEESTAFEGTGIWQKEVESEDAFSAYDENTAISFKNNRAVFVYPNGDAIWFPSCERAN